MTTSPPITAADASRLGPLLGFHPTVEAQFERETGAERVQQLRHTIYVGLMFYNVYTVTTVVVMPDVLCLAVVLRLLVVTPMGLGIAWAVGRVSAAWREVAVLGGTISAVSVPVFLLWASQAPYALYASSQAFLTMVFATMMLVLRFPHALAFIAATLLMAVPSYYLKRGNPPALAHELALEMLSASFFVLYGNYRLERSVRRSFLATLRATLRSADLQVDKTALERLSRVDPLTGIANRRRLSERLAAWHADAGNHDRPLAVVMVDVDHFKRYNDAHGHPAGDGCLIQVARAMDGCLRDDRDLLARYGGEEFAVLLPDADAAEASVVAQRLCDAVVALAMPHDHRDDGMSVVTVSAGVASATVNARRRARALFEAADAALYTAKQRGRNQQAVAAVSEPPISAPPSGPAPPVLDGWDRPDEPPSGPPSSG